MTLVLDFLEYIRKGVPFEDLLWAAYGIIGVLIIKKAVKRITETVTFGGALCCTLLYTAAFSVFNLFSLYMLTPDIVMQLFSG